MGCIGRRLQTLIQNGGSFLHAKAGLFGIFTFLKWTIYEIWKS